MKRTEVRWLGHSTVLVEMDDVRILTDPVLRNRLGPIHRRVPAYRTDLGTIDAVLISHLHHDHMDVPSLRKLDPDVRLVVPVGSGAMLSRLGFNRITELRAGAATSVGALRVAAVAAAHSGRRLPFGPSAPALGYVIDGSRSIYFAGDTDLFSGMARIRSGLDLALLPVGGWGPTLRGGHLNPERAAEALALLKPATAIPIHWGTFWPVGLDRPAPSLHAPAARFHALASVSAPDVAVSVLRPGESFGFKDRLVRPCNIRTNTASEGRDAQVT
jgi:L-ascorbate metabolism protein UlaG (beta-lactamase superfamily)